MAPPQIGVRRLHPDAQLPRYAHGGPHGDLAADLHLVEPALLNPGETRALRTGLSFSFPEGFGAIVHDRSSLALRGLTTLAGVIDPGFRGELKVVLHNLGPQPQQLQPGDRIAQLRIVPLLQAAFAEMEEHTETERHTGGFGSTGA